MHKFIVAWEAQSALTLHVMLVSSSLMSQTQLLMGNTGGNIMLEILILNFTNQILSNYVSSERSISVYFLFLCLENEALWSLTYSAVSRCSSRSVNASKTVYCPLSSTG